MIVVADTNIIVRIAAKVDNLEQKAAAIKLLDEARNFVIPITVFCEYCWVLRKNLSREQIAASIRFLLRHENVVADTQAVHAGLRMLDAGGDFADGVIQHTGSQLADAPSVFASFDQQAVRLLAAQGFATLVPTAHTPSVNGGGA